jgi:YD repeat-containing protein
MMKLSLLSALIILPLAAAVNYTYDAAGRLVKVDYGNGSTISYTYDKAGNLLSRSVKASSGPAISSVTVANGGTDIAQDTWIVIKGSNLVPAATPAAGVIWSDAPDFASGKLPTQLSGVSVTVNGKAAFIYFYCSAATSSICSADQINVLTPLDATLGQGTDRRDQPGGDQPAVFSELEINRARLPVIRSRRLRRGDACEWKSARPDESVSRSFDAGQSRRDDRALRGRLRASNHCLGQRLIDSIRTAANQSRLPAWRKRGGGELRGIDQSRALSTEYCGAEFGG